MASSFCSFKSISPSCQGDCHLFEIPDPDEAVFSTETLSSSQDSENVPPLIPKTSLKSRPSRAIKKNEFYCMSRYTATPFPDALSEVEADPDWVPPQPKRKRSKQSDGPGPPSKRHAMRTIHEGSEPSSSAASHDDVVRNHPHDIGVDFALDILDTDIKRDTSEECTDNVLERQKSRDRRSPLPGPVVQEHDPVISRRRSGYSPRVVIPSTQRIKRELIETSKCFPRTPSPRSSSLAQDWRNLNKAKALSAAAINRLIVIDDDDPVFPCSTSSPGVMGRDKGKDTDSSRVIDPLSSLELNLQSNVRKEVRNLQRLSQAGQQDTRNKSSAAANAALLKQREGYNTQGSLPQSGTNSLRRETDHSTTNSPERSFQVPSQDKRSHRSATVTSSEAAQDLNEHVSRPKRSKAALYREMTDLRQWVQTSLEEMRAQMIAPALSTQVNTQEDRVKALESAKETFQLEFRTEMRQLREWCQTTVQEVKDQSSHIAFSDHLETQEKQILRLETAGKNLQQELGNEIKGLRNDMKDIRQWCQTCFHEMRNQLGVEAFRHQFSRDHRALLSGQLGGSMEMQKFEPTNVLRHWYDTRFVDIRDQIKRFDERMATIETKLTTLAWETGERRRGDAR